MDNNEQVVNNRLKEGTAQALKKYPYQGDIKRVKTAARAFINSIQTLIDTNNIMDHQTKIRKARVRYSEAGEAGIANDITELYNRMKEAGGPGKEITRAAIAAQEDFAKKYHEYMGRSLILSYVRTDGTVYFLNEYLVQKLYTTTTGVDSGGGRGKITAAAMERFARNNSKYMKYNQNLAKELQKKLNESVNRRKIVFTTAVARRAKPAIEKHEKGVKNSFYWREGSLPYPKNMRYSKDIPDVGRIAEGYMRLIMEDDPMSDESLEYLLSKLNSLIQKDSKPAAVEEDIMIDMKTGQIKLNTGNIGVAVKSGEFSTPMMGQYIRLAYNFLAIPDEIPFEDIKKNIEKLIDFSKVSHDIIADFKKQVTEEVKKELSKTMKAKT